MKKEKKKLESDIQREICDWLSTKSIFFWRSNNVPVFAKSNDGKMRFRALPKYTPKGLPDIIAIVNGIFIGIEVKRPGEKLRPGQNDFQMKCCDNGGKYLVVHSIEEMKECYRDFIEPLFP